MKTLPPPTLAEAIRRDPTFLRLEEMSRRLTGVILLVFLRRGRRIQELYATGRRELLPEFCALIRNSPAGRRRCQACRHLIALGAFCRGADTFRCHGGVALVAAPAKGGWDDCSDAIAVTSCAFADVSHDTGWRDVRRYARDLPVDLVKLEAAYRRLPLLDEKRREWVKEIVATAAVAVGEISRDGSRTVPATAAPAHARGRNVMAWEREIGPLLQSSRTESAGGNAELSGTTLVGLVRAMVARNPGLPFNVANIARAARLTPNHFSMLFRKHTGETFTAFVTALRIERARGLLRDVRLNVAEVADQVGFTDSGYFCRRFKQVVGQTPAEWRQGR
jgi:AraC-like DNA-binding protein